MRQRGIFGTWIKSIPPQLTMHLVSGTLSRMGLKSEPGGRRKSRRFLVLRTTHHAPRFVHYVVLFSSSYSSSVAMKQMNPSGKVRN